MLYGGDFVRRCAAYIRVSTDDQAELSPESQLEEIKKYALRESLVLLPEHIYADTGISGKSASNRPEFMRMIAAAKGPDCPFSVILLWKYSRFARNQEESIFYKSVLRSKCGVDVVSVTEPLVSGPFGSLIERIIEWMDEFYSIRLSQEVRRSMALNASQGRLQSAPPFGYRASGGTLEVVAEEADWVRHIYSSFLSGRSTRSIALELNDAGVHTHRGGNFESRTIEYILRNPAYTGQLRWHERGGDVIVAQGSHKPILDRASWEAAQRRLDDLKSRCPPHSRPADGLKFWAGGLVRCAVCGSTLVYEKGGRCKCNGYARGRCRESQRTPVSVLESAIMSRLELDSRDAAPAEYELLPPQPPPDASLPGLRSSLRRAAAEKRRLLDAYTSGALDLEAFRRAAEELSARCGRLESSLRALEASPYPCPSAQLESSVRAALTSLSDAGGTLEERNAAARCVLESCVYSRSGDKLTLIYRLDM